MYGVDRAHLREISQRLDFGQCQNCLLGKRSFSVMPRLTVHASNIRMAEKALIQEGFFQKDNKTY
jgi:hypothetical protein